MATAYFGVRHGRLATLLLSTALVWRPSQSERRLATLLLSTDAWLGPLLATAYFGVQRGRLVTFLLSTALVWRPAQSDGHAASRAKGRPVER